MTVPPLDPEPTPTPPPVADVLARIAGPGSDHVATHADRIRGIIRDVPGPQSKQAPGEWERTVADRARGRTTTGKGASDDKPARPQPTNRQEHTTE